MGNIENIDSVESILKSLAKDNRIKKENKLDVKEEKKSLFGKKSKKSSIYLKENDLPIENVSDLDDENECIFNEDMDIGDIEMISSGLNYEFGPDEEIIEETIDEDIIDINLNEKSTESDTKNLVDDSNEVAGVVDISDSVEDIPESVECLKSKEANGVQNLSNIDDIEEVDDFSEDLFSDLPLLDMFPDLISAKVDTEDNDFDIIDTGESKIEDDVDLSKTDFIESSDNSEKKVVSDLNKNEVTVTSLNDSEIDDIKDKNLDINFSNHNNINILDEDDKFKNCIFYKGMSIEDYLRQNPKYREKLYVEHFFAKDYLDKMLKSGMILFSKGCYRL